MGYQDRPRLSVASTRYSDLGVRNGDSHKICKTLVLVVKCKKRRNRTTDGVAQLAEQLVGTCVRTAADGNQYPSCPQYFILRQAHLELISQRCDGDNLGA